MKKSIVILIHVGFWFCYSVLILIILNVYYRSSPHIVDQAPQIINALESLLLFAVLPSVISYFSYYYLLFPHFLKQKKFATAVVL